MSECSQKSTVLIVDDTPQNIHVLMEAIEDDCRVLAAKSGEEALGRVREDIPDLILLDVMMPGMDGFEVCRRLKSDDRTCRIPVIFVTALDSTQDEEKGLKCGAVDYISKPFKPVIVKARVKNHLELQRSRKELQKLEHCVENSPSIVLITDKDGRIEYANPAFSRITGYSMHEVAGLCPGSMIGPEQQSPFYNILLGVMESDQVWQGEFLNYKKDGQAFWQQATIAPVKDHNQDTTHYVSVMEDISSRKQLEKLKEDVERIMRHDLKTPIDGIIGISEYFKDYQGLEQEDRDLLQLLNDSGWRLKYMIENSLNLLRMEQGTYEFTPRRVDALSVARQVIKELEPVFQVKKNQAVISFGSQEPGNLFMLEAEEQLLYGILSNLIRNAFEASPAGENISVHFSRVPEPSISIMNKGAVPAALREDFFEKYTTLGKKCGTGLGTYSARLMSRTMGYDLRLDTSDTMNMTTVSMLLWDKSGKQN